MGLLVVKSDGCFGSAAVRSDDSDSLSRSSLLQIKRRDFCSSLATCGGGHIHVP
jgi:hypothetical protein